MNIETLIQLLENKLTTLNNAKNQSFLSGDIERISALDIEILEAQDTLYKLRLMIGLSAAAQATGVPESAVVASGIEATVTAAGASPTVVGEAAAIITNAQESLDAAQPPTEPVAPEPTAPTE